MLTLTEQSMKLYHKAKKQKKKKRGAENGEKLPKLYVCNVYDDWHLEYSRHYLICL